MKIFQMKKISQLVAIAAVSCSSSVMADSISEAIASGTAYGDFRLRFEGVDQDNSLKDAEALTLRSRLGYTTGSLDGFSATIEFEDSRVVGGVDDFNAAGLNGMGAYSVVADPETTEVDQAFLQYKTDGFTTKLGRQVITLDGHRFVGHVGWRQDRQTFDAFTLDLAPTEGLSLKYGYINKRNRIFADERDIQSDDHLFNASYQTSLGKLTTYAYLLEEDDSGISRDSYGVSFKGVAEVSEDAKFLYALEFATQDFESGSTKYDADYMLIEGGLAMAGITGKLGYEVLGSDDGMYGFTTELATLHKFNGWADQFLATPSEGLVDTYFSLGGKAFGGGWSIVYHDYEADEGSIYVDDLGDEINISYAKKFGKHYNAGIKYASYDAGDIKVDTDKLWVWVGVKF